MFLVASVVFLPVGSTGFEILVSMVPVDMSVGMANLGVCPVFVQRTKGGCVTVLA